MPILLSLLREIRDYLREIRDTLTREERGRAINTNLPDHHQKEQRRRG